MTFTVVSRRANHKNISDMDEAMEDDLSDIKEDQGGNEDTEAALEAGVPRQTLHAADADAGNCLRQCIKLLTVVEDQYGTTNYSATKAEEHPVNDVMRHDLMAWFRVICVRWGRRRYVCRG